MVIGINAGHTKSGAGSGAVGFLRESDETRVVAEALKRILVNSGVTVRDCTVDYAKSRNAYLAEAVRLANDRDLDWFVSIHFNAGGGRGVEVYTYGGRQYQDAVEVCANIAALGFRNRGVKAGTGFYVIRKSKAKSMLIEVCFVDTADAEQYRKVGAEKIARAIAAALISYAAPSTPAEKLPEAPVKPEKQKYVRVKVEELNIRKAPTWDAKDIAGMVRKREVFTVKETLVVGKTPMHRLKSGLYITAHPAYVETYEK